MISSIVFAGIALGSYIGLITMTHFKERKQVKLDKQMKIKLVKSSKFSEKMFASSFQMQLLKQGHAFDDPHQGQSGTFFGVDAEIVRYVENDLLSFADKLKDKSFYVNCEDLVAGSDYVIDEGFYRMQVTMGMYGYVATLLYTEEGKTDTLCSAAFTYDPEKKTEESIVVHYGYSELHHSISQVYVALTECFMNDFARHTGYSGKENNSSPVKQMNEDVFSKMASLNLNIDAPAPANKQKTENDEIRTLTASLMNLQEELVLTDYPLGIENEHRITTILNDCENLLTAYHSLAVNNETVENQIVLGLQVAIEKLNEIQGAGTQMIAEEVVRQVEILRQR